MIRTLHYLPVVLAVLAPAVPARADEGADLEAFAKATRAMYFATAGARDLPGPRLELHADATDADLTRLAAIKPKALKTLNLGYCHKVTQAGVAKLGTLPSVTCLWLPSTIADKAYEALPAQFPNLEILVVKGIFRESSGLTDAGAAHLTKWGKLTSVSLLSARVTDKVWAKLAKIPNLTEVIVADCGVSGVGLKQLAACPKLTSLNLIACELTEPGFREIAELTSLTRLLFYETGLKDRDVARLAGLKKLEFLELEREKKLTDAALRSIAQMPALRTLSVLLVPFTDRGLEHLKAAKTLREVRLNFTFVTPAGIERLRKALPGADIQKNK